MKNERLKQQIDFILEIDKLKHIYRQTLLVDGSRHENDAEHSWHLAMMALLLCEHASEMSIDMFRVVKMVLIHDLVEIDNGDTFCYDEEAARLRLAKERERETAKRLFHLLPEDQAEEFQQLWEEFEQQITPEACFAASLDRLQPLLHNYKTGGYSWKKHGVTHDKVLRRTEPIRQSSSLLWAFVQELIQDSVSRGYLHRN